MTSFTAGLLFLISLIFAPFFLAIPSFATTPALVYVGFLMLLQIRHMNFTWSKKSDFIPSFLAISMMPFTNSIANGIMFGIISYIVLKVVEGDAKDIKPVMWISGALFVIYILIG
jgi:AGZA family xanthine/uracil permease-like MFS transporter